MYTSKTLYFEKGGREHSQAALSAMKERAEAMDPAPEAIVVTSTTGDTALKAAQAFKGTGRRIIAVPFQKHLWAAYAGLNPEHRAACAELGVEFLPDEPRVPLVDEERPDIVNAWRVVSQGFKVALQAASMCVDTGLVEDGAVSAPELVPPAAMTTAPSSTRPVSTHMDAACSATLNPWLTTRHAL
ncbi:MAG TPA: hypothetical protein HPP77_10335, partial [Candidatus Hydrogenedentes bacterium]|nr:hypothetical protein [Candidatus Hydrogenedentota bacterium]